MYETLICKTYAHIKPKMSLWAKEISKSLRNRRANLKAKGGWCDQVMSHAGLSLKQYIIIQFVTYFFLSESYS